MNMPLLWASVILLLTSVSFLTYGKIDHWIGSGKHLESPATFLFMEASVFIWLILASVLLFAGMMVVLAY